MDDGKKQFFELLKQWDENLEIIWEREENYKAQLIEKYKIFIEGAKKEFIQYSIENGFQIVQQSNFIKSTYGDNYFSVRIQFYDVLPNDRYSYDLSIIENNRRDFTIYIIPLIPKLYIPKWSNTITRPRPKNIIEIKKCIIDLQEEYLFLDKKSEELKKANFEFCHHSAERNSPNLAELESYSDFLSILKKLLKN